MKIIGLDLSTKSTGVSIFEKDKLIYYKCITESSNNVLKRITNITKAIANILLEYKPDLVIIEDPLPADVHNNIDVYKKLTYLQGFIVVTLDSFGISYALVTASHWRKKCGIKTGTGIKREELKSSDIKFVKNKFGLDVNDDIADAIGIGWCGVLETNQ